MNIIWYYLAGRDGIHKHQIMQDLQDKKPNRIVLFGETEWEIQGIDKELVDLCKTQKTKINIVHGCFKSEYHIDLYDKLGIDINDVTFWGTYWFNFTESHISNNIKNYQNLVDVTEYKYPFLNMNCRSHIHRCILVDELAKRNLINKGKVSWHDHLQENQNFIFRYFNRNQKLLLDDSFEHTLNSFTVPNCYFDTFMLVITESTLNVPFITEKTVMPLLLKKPFLAVANENYYEALQHLGFKLYDEVFNYNFIKEKDLYKKIELVVDNLDYVISKNLSDLYNTIKEKVNYNQQLAIEITKNSEIVPNIVKEKLRYNTIGLSTKSSVDERFQEHLQKCNYNL